MSAFTRLLGKLFGGTPPAPEPAPAPPPAAPAKPTRRTHGPAARFDAAQTGPENQNHWANADGLSANAAASPDVRRILRYRSRYERANNGYAKGVIRGRTNDTIGTGPRLQLDFPEATYDPDFQRPVSTTPPGLEPADLARQVERLWCDWFEQAAIADKLRIMADAEDTDGEAFGLLVTNLAFEGVTLDLRVIECDRVTDPFGLGLEPGWLDGIRYDADGNPAEYRVLHHHPGDMWPYPAAPRDASPFAAGVGAFTAYPARQVIHLFDADRPEQTRGIPLLTPALPLYSILRRYTLASLGAAEVGAMIAGIITNPNLPDDGTNAAPEFQEMDSVPFSRNALLTLPAGADAKAFDSKNPSPNYHEFKSEVLTEAGRAAGEMRNTATGSSAEYNYSSGRLDHLPRQRGIEIRRDRYDRKALDRLFRAWAAEAALIPDYLPAGLPPLEAWDWRWRWDGFPSIDPLKDASAAQVRKEIGLTTDADELAREGKDWREHYRQLAREKQLREQLGIALPAPAAPTPAPAAEVADA